jgi:hypothetical protein
LDHLGGSEQQRICDRNRVAGVQVESAEAIEPRSHHVVRGPNEDEELADGACFDRSANVL